MEFPHLVEMHKKLASQGFAAISVDLDDAGDKESMDRVQDYLKRQQAAFTNLVLNEKPEYWQEQLPFTGPPYVFVFNREGRIALQTNNPDYKKINLLVEELLKQK